ncbi:MAG: capsular polysaccharide biosynthesis protein [Chlamydiales bacterium]|jgi:capsular polysaccharide biosynthesis protein
MAVEVESTSQVEEFLGVLLRRIWWICVPAAMLLAIGSAVAVVIPKKYVSTTRLMVRDALADLDGTNSERSSSREAQVAEHQIRSLRRVSAVLESLRWPEYLELSRADQYEYVRTLQDRIEVDIPPMSRGTGQQVVSIEFSHTDPDHAFQFLDALQLRWKDEVLERGRSAEYRAYDQLKGAKEEKEKERERIYSQATELRKRYGIPPPSALVDALQGSGVGEPVFGLLRENRAELSDVQARVEILRGQIVTGEELLARMDDLVTQVDTDRGSNYRRQIKGKRDEILELQLTRQERKYLPQHPAYRSIQDKIDVLEGQIKVLQSSETADIHVETWVPNKKKTDLAKQLEAQRRGLESNEAREIALIDKIAEQRDHSLEIHDVHAQLRQWEEDLYRIGAELEEIDLAYQRKERRVRWIDGPGGDPFEVLSKVNLPTKPTEPNPLLIVAFSLFLGLGLGLGLAILTEYRKNCFRSGHDLSRVMVVPVLGTVNTIITRAERMRRLFGRVVAAGATFGFVGMMAYVTWAWSSNPHLLSDQVIDAIEQFRSRFK